MPRSAPARDAADARFRSESTARIAGGAAKPGHDDPALAPLVKGLTAAQAEAVAHEDGPLLVLAAAGSGKTLTITRRIAYLIGRGNPPWSILALTFTNKAATEMRERIERLVPPAVGTARGLTVSTFHTFCARLLRRYAEKVGLDADYSIYDTGDQRAAIKTVTERLNLSPKNFPPDAVASNISNAKNKLTGPAEFKRAAGDFWSRQFARIYEEYEAYLRKNNAVDFDDLLFHVATLLRDDEEVRAELQARYRHILIDEYQDTNHAQFVIADSLAAKHRHICVVGDPDQSIYGWRGADITNILEFQEHYPEARVVKLGENFRSTAPILHAADHLIKHNKHRKDKPLYTTKVGGEKPVVMTCADEHHEAVVVADWLTELNRDHGLPWKGMAVFYRTNALSRVMEAALRERTIPYVIVRGTAFYERKEVKDAIGYLRLTLNPHDNVAVERVLNEPPRGIGDTTVKKVQAFAREHGLSLFDAMARCREVSELNARAISAIEKFVRMVRGWRGEDAAGGPAAAIANRGETVGELAQLASRVVTESGLEAHYRKSGTDEDAQRLDNLDELVSSAAEFENDFDVAKAAGAMTDPLADDPFVALDLTMLPPLDAPEGFEADGDESDDQSDLAVDEDADIAAEGGSDKCRIETAKGAPSLAPRERDEELVGGGEGVYPRPVSRGPGVPPLAPVRSDEAHGLFSDLIPSDTPSPALPRGAGEGDTSAARERAPEDLMRSLSRAPEQPEPSALPSAAAAGPSTLFIKLRAYLEQVALVSDVEAFDPDAGAVTLMTLHAAKGLEFPAVAMIGLEEGLLPHGRARESDMDLEEERRLAFVGITRAKERLLITHALCRTIRGMREPTMTSRFLAQLPEDGIEWRGARRRAHLDDDEGTDVDALDVRAGSVADFLSRGGSGTRRSAPGGRDATWSGRSGVASRPAGVSNQPFPVGSRVMHPQFGEGSVESAGAAGQHTRLRVRFRDAGVKTLIAEYARLQRLA